jgi:hypothetical protein
MQVSFFQSSNIFRVDCLVNGAIGRLRSIISQSECISACYWHQFDALYMCVRRSPRFEYLMDHQNRRKSLVGVIVSDSAEQSEITVEIHIPDSNQQ